MIVWCSPCVFYFSPSWFSPPLDFDFILILSFFWGGGTGVFILLFFLFRFFFIINSYFFSTGFGFVWYDDPRDADDAVKYVFIYKILMILSLPGQTCAYIVLLALLSLLLSSISCFCHFHNSNSFAHGSTFPKPLPLSCRELDNREVQGKRLRKYPRLSVCPAMCICVV